MKMCYAFALSGNEVILIAPDIEDIEREVIDCYEYYGVSKSFKIIKLPWIKLKGRTYIYGLLAAIKAIFIKPDLVYGRFLPGCYFSSLFNLNIIYEAHAPIKDLGFITEWMFKKLIYKNKLKSIIVISNALKSYYIKTYNIPEKLITVAHDGADPIYADDESELVSESIKVGYLGHLYPGRGIEIIVELAKKCPWAEFHIIGGTNSDIEFWRGRTKNLINITLYGFISHSETIKFRLLCDVLIAPYQKRVAVYGGRGNTVDWMSPLKIFEYMAAGKAILCSDIPVLKEVLVHEKNSLLCNPDDIGSWLSSLERLKNDSELRQSLGKRAQEDFIEKYTWTARASFVLKGGLG
jgi:glycosyltransferase involved in cell wall biosynthesis